MYHIVKIDSVMVGVFGVYKFVFNTDRLRNILGCTYLWVEGRINNQPHILGIFYSLKPQDQIFLELST